MDPLAGKEIALAVAAGAPCRRLYFKGGAASVKVGRRPSITVYFTVYLYTFHFSGNERPNFSAWAIPLTARFWLIYAGFRVSPAVVWSCGKSSRIPQRLGCAIPQRLGWYSPKIGVNSPKIGVASCGFCPKFWGGIPKKSASYSQNFCGLFYQTSIITASIVFPFLRVLKSLIKPFSPV